MTDGQRSVSGSWLSLVPVVANLNTRGRHNRCNTILERHPSAAHDVIALADAAGVEHDDPKTLRAGGVAPPP